MRSRACSRGAGDHFGGRPEVGDEGSHVTLGLVDLDALDHGADQPPAVLRTEGVPDPVEIGEAARDPFGLEFAAIEKRKAVLDLPEARFQAPRSEERRVGKECKSQWSTRTYTT